MSDGNIYKTKCHIERDQISYLFCSSGNQEVIKIIQFSFIQELNNRPVYNLGFGDYMLESNSIIYDAILNNGDVYRVFNTVLSTIPLFLRLYTNAIVMVQGSDSSDAFVKDCRRTCINKCTITCKKQHRRINIYKHYINKNYAFLRNRYNLFGSFELFNDNLIIEKYSPGENYISLFVTKKNL